MDSIIFFSENSVEARITHIRVSPGSFEFIIVSHADETDDNGMLLFYINRIRVNKTVINIRIFQRRLINSSFHG